jgi:hypothetical protein
MKEQDPVHNIMSTHIVAVDVDERLRKVVELRLKARKSGIYRL